MSEVLHFIIYEDNKMNEDIEYKYNELINYFKNKDYIYDDLSILIVERTNDNLIYFNKILTDILIRTKESVKLDILNDSSKYGDLFKDDEIFYEIWNSLKKKKKLDYFRDKSKFSDIDIYIILKVNTFYLNNKI